MMTGLVNRFIRVLYLQKPKIKRAKNSRKLPIKLSTSKVKTKNCIGISAV